MAKAEVIKRDITVILTLNEDEAKAVMALTGACAAERWGGIAATQNVYDTLCDIFGSSYNDEYVVSNDAGNIGSLRLTKRN